MDPKPNRTNQIIIGIIVVLLVILGIYFITRKPAGTAEETTSPTPAITEAGTNDNKLVVGDQTPGGVVYTSSVTLANGGWVVVWDESNGAPGKIIGSKYYSAGTAPASVSVDPATVEGQNYYVALYADDGDQKFDITKDLPLTDASGNPILLRFKATQQFEEVKG